MKRLLLLSLLICGVCSAQIEVSKSSKPITIGEFKNFGGLMVKIEVIDEFAYITYRDTRFTTLSKFESFFFNKKDLDQVYNLFFSENLKIGESQQIELENGDIVYFTKSKMMGKKYVSVTHIENGITRTLPYMKTKNINKLFGK